MPRIEWPGRQTLMDSGSVPESETVDHQVEIVQRDRRTKGDDAAYWRCTCGQSAGGRWYRSKQEAAKAADRHLSRARD